jgi:ankyrin repeat protein
MRVTGARTSAIGALAVLGATPYWLAARFAEPEIMKVLAGHGASTRLTLDDGTTPLMAAMMGPLGSGDRRDRFLTEAEIAVKPPNEDARVALETVTLALALGADVHGTNKAGDTAVRTAAARALPAVVEKLSRHGAPLAVKNTRGLTPLAIASSTRRGTDVFAEGAGASRQARPSPTAEMLRILEASE